MKPFGENTMDKIKFTPEQELRLHDMFVFGTPFEELPHEHMKTDPACEWLKDEFIRQMNEVANA